VTTCCRQSASQASLAGPQFRSTVHLVSSPTVTNEMHQVWPVSRARKRISQATAQAGGGDVGIEDDEAHATSARRDAYRSARNSFHS
jgi:hypothetical protein